ncbi:tripartite tricarboxylate transporter TctB family protein [Ramlibacter sp. AN1015]|uniref:tripartite tricarboxylate transporter TctB family protein n=1 Tax=Ramlibacter sp. AN1015 TaxID=3133428 RepID=UPI0030C3ECBB
MSSAPSSGGGASPRSDLLGALVWVAFGGAIALAAWRMDRLENLHINTYEVPGLVPGLLGCMLAVLGVLLALRALRRGALRRAESVTQPRAGAAGGAGRATMALVLATMLVYALVMVGHGLPFWLSTLVFVTGFILLFDRARQSALGRPAWKQVALALAMGAATSAVVSLGFEHVFYVRLP